MSGHLITVHRVKKSPATGVWISMACLTLAPVAFATAPADPGVRPGPTAAGGPLPGLTDTEQRPFWLGWERFRQKHSVAGLNPGLGPAFNALSCAQCHAQPAAGGSSTNPDSPQVRRVVFEQQRLALDAQPNPQVALASLHRVPGGDQTVPSFITPDGPIRVARFIRHPDGTPDGSVHPLYTVAGREDAPGCNLEPPDFSAEMAQGNVAFRVPSPAFGDGLIEAVPDSALQANLRATQDQRRAFGIGGRFNRDDTGALTRFGWKAQGRNVRLFSAESQHIEIGSTNSIFPDSGAQEAAAHKTGCLAAAAPATAESQAAAGSADLARFVAFIRLSAPPAPSTHTESELNGRELFSQVGCNLCHSPSLQTGHADLQPMSHVTVAAYSDFALHHMGPGLADHISQGVASGDEFRTAPLWGLGQRIFFLHDGRTSDLVEAIRAHASVDAHCTATRPNGEACASEANASIHAFAALSDARQQALLEFLRSL